MKPKCTEEQTKLLNSWVAALRSGKYSQARQRMRGDQGYCCLGVLCDIIDPRGWLEPAPGVTSFSHQGEFYAPSKHLRKLLPESVNADFATFMSMNDDERKSFSEIADYIESLYETN